MAYRARANAHGARLSRVSDRQQMRRLGWRQALQIVLKELQAVKAPLPFVLNRGEQRLVLVRVPAHLPLLRLQPAQPEEVLQVVQAPQLPAQPVELVQGVVCTGAPREHGGHRFRQPVQVAEAEQQRAHFEVVERAGRQRPGLLQRLWLPDHFRLCLWLLCLLPLLLSGRLVGSVGAFGHHGQLLDAASPAHQPRLQASPAARGPPSGPETSRHGSRHRLRQREKQQTGQSHRVHPRTGQIDRFVR
eukprot:scaffold31_cov263-Pinguiococcus_pyrenoidosus.AAC.63